MKIRTFIVDDESLARDRLRQLLKTSRRLRSPANTPTGDAAAAIQKTPPDLSFWTSRCPNSTASACSKPWAPDPCR